MTWTAVADEMPDSDTTVLVHFPDEDEPVWLGYWDGGEWRDVQGIPIGVTHWADLPEPP